MKKMMIVLTAVAMFCTLPAAKAVSAEDKAALVTAPFEHETLVHNFGRVKDGKVLKRRFILKNDTGKPLSIKEVTTSCGCTASKAKKNKLGPDEETFIDVTFNTKGYYGPTKQFVYVHTDDTLKPVVTFIVKANVEK